MITSTDIKRATDTALADQARLVEERIRDHFNGRAIAGLSPCDYRVNPHTFQGMAQRLVAKIECDEERGQTSFVTLHLEAGSTRMYASEHVVGEGEIEWWERLESVPTLPPLPRILVGDVVRLKGGGMTMTVIDVSAEHCVCAWSQAASGFGGFGGFGQVQTRERFPIAALDLLAGAAKEH